VKGMYRVYEGNSGRSRKVEEPRRAASFRGKTLAPVPTRQEKKEPERERREIPKSKPPGPGTGLSGDLAKLMGKLGSLSLETEDLLLIAVLYLMYRESGDKELLIMIGALLFL